MVAWGSRGRLGVSSITLKDLPAAQVAQVAGRSVLSVVEWAEVHAPPGRPEELANAARAAEAAGLQASSYGSYWRAGVSDAGEFVDVVRAARAVGTSRIRIWAGAVGSAEASSQDWAAVIGATREAALIAADQGCEVAFEFHGESLTDTVDGTVRLLEEVGSVNLSTYWQPPVDASVPDAVDGLRRLVDRVSAVHVFSWWPGTMRLALRERTDLWSSVFDVLAAHDSSTDLLLEFVPGDDPDMVVSEAAVLEDLVAAAQGRVA